MSPKVTIVIPMYNAARYLPQCLDSVLSQTLREIEVLCIDDCSTDDTLSVARHYAGNDSRLRVIQMSANSGPSAVRNEGLRQAAGEYVGFVDSDDWVDADYFERLFTVAQLHASDYVINTTFTREYADHTEPLRWLYAEYPADGMEIDNAYCANSLYCMPYARLISRELINRHNLRFPLEFRIHEDDFFHRVSCLCAQKVVVCGGSTYHYRNTESSITNTMGTQNKYYLLMFRALKNHYGDGIFDSQFQLKLFNRMLFSQITTDDYLGVKQYVEELQPYLQQSGVRCSDFDRYAITHLLDSTSHGDLMKRIGNDPWIRYNTLQRIKNKMSIKVSVIIPVYNTEHYLARCLDSVCRQTLHDIEILCVNDASTDNSLAVLRQFAFEDNRIQIIDLKENGGVSNARNTAIKAARGEYIYFIDSDDWIDLTFLETMLHTIECQKADIIINTCFVNEFDDPQKKQYSNFDFYAKEGEHIAASTLQRLFPPTIWSRLYRRSFLVDNGITFPIVKGGAEDIFFSYACDLTVGSVYVFEGDYYHYYQRSTSAMHTASRGFHYIESFRLLWTYLREHSISLSGIKLFYVESLILDTPEKYAFTRQYLQDIRPLVEADTSLYNAQELFLLDITNRITLYDEFKAQYNPNIALSFIRHHITQKR